MHPDHLPFSSSLSAPLACWFSRRLSAVHICYPYRPILVPDHLALAVTTAPHGLVATLSSVATLSQELRKARLLLPHVLVGYRQPNAGLFGDYTSNK